MPLQTPLRVSVSTWALHPILQTVAPGRPGDPTARLMPEGNGAKTDLLHIPSLLAQNGITTMELCHFHLPTTAPAYLAEWKAAREAAGVELWSYLIDDGDLTDPQHNVRDRDWILGQIDIAAQLGARCVRVIAGKQDATLDSLALAREHFQTLVVEAFLRGVRVMTENWFPLLSNPRSVHLLMDGLQDSVGLCLDFGNWRGRYDDLASIAGYAESCHAKCNYQNGTPDADDFRRCLEITREAGFSGPYTLVYAEAGDVWGSLAAQRVLIVPFLES